MEFTDLNPTRFLIAGDTHGNAPHVQKLCKWARQAGIDTIVQVGDFGFVWDDFKPYGNRDEYGKRKYMKLNYPAPTRLDRLSNLLMQGGMKLVFLDGNHEDFDRLAFLGVSPQDEQPSALARNIFYVPRGFTWEWDSVRFMAMGGAFSVDHGGRDIGVDWWPEETISYQDVYYAETQGEVDVLLSHDAPEGIPQLQKFLETKKIMDHLDRTIGYGYKLDRASASNREALRAVAESVNPRLIVHGHYHHRYNGEWVNPRTGRAAKVVGLNRDKQGRQSYALFDTSEFHANYKTGVAT